jgi:uncharacterized protein (TIGR03083 family)
MSLQKDEVVQGLPTEVERFHRLIAGLTDQDWGQPTRCEEWTVGDLAGHITGVFSDITAGRLDGAGTQQWYDRQVAERRGRAPAEVADELATVVPLVRDQVRTRWPAAWESPGPPGAGGTLGSIALSLWGGTYLHIEDILVALDRPPQRGPGLRAQVWHIAGEWERRGWKPVTLALHGMEEIPVAGGGDTVTGDPLLFALAASGRGDPGSFGLDVDINVYA